MLFTRLGRIVAFFALVIGISWVIAGFAVAFGFVESKQTALVEFFPSMESTGAVINRGMYTALFGIIVGILTEISYGVRAKPEMKTSQPRRAIPSNPTLVRGTPEPVALVQQGRRTSRGRDNL